MIDGKDRLIVVFIHDFGAAPGDRSVGTLMHVVREREGDRWSEPRDVVISGGGRVRVADFSVSTGVDSSSSEFHLIAVLPNGVLGDSLGFIEAFGRDDAPIFDFDLCRIDQLDSRDGFFNVPELSASPDNDWYVAAFQFVPDGVYEDAERWLRVDDEWDDLCTAPDREDFVPNIFADPLSSDALDSSATPVAISDNGTAFVALFDVILDIVNPLQSEFTLSVLNWEAGELLANDPEPLPLPGDTGQYSHFLDLAAFSLLVSKDNNALAVHPVMNENNGSAVLTHSERANRIWTPALLGQRLGDMARAVVDKGLRLHVVYHVSPSEGGAENAIAYRCFIP